MPKRGYADFVMLFYNREVGGVCKMNITDQKGVCIMVILTVHTFQACA